MTNPHVGHGASVPLKMLKSGKPPLEYALALDLGPYAGLGDRERIVPNLHRAASELRGEPRGTPIPLLAAIQEMVAYNGGAPLRCFA